METQTADGRDLSKEEWQQIPGFSKYEITKDGDVRNIRTGKLISETENKTTGAWSYCLWKDDGNSTHRNWQRLVWLAYPELKEIKEQEKPKRRYSTRGQWKDIPGFPQYQLHQDGVVRYRVSRRRRQIHEFDGVRYVFLIDSNSKEHSRTIDELLLEVFPADEQKEVA